MGQEGKEEKVSRTHHAATLLNTICVENQNATAESVLTEWERRRKKKKKKDNAHMIVHSLLKHSSGERKQTARVQTTLQPRAGAVYP